MAAAVQEKPADVKSAEKFDWLAPYIGLGVLYFRSGVRKQGAGTFGIVTKVNDYGTVAINLVSPTFNHMERVDSVQWVESPTINDRQREMSGVWDHVPHYKKMVELLNKV